jgi:hypothetical protein
MQINWRRDVGKALAKALGETAREFSRRYQTSSWAKKVSVWAA